MIEQIATRCKLIVLTIPLIIYACGSISKKSSQTPIDDYNLNMSERDMNISAIIEYMKYEYKDCKDTCDVIVNGEIEKIDTCYLEFYHREIEKLKFNHNKKIVIGPNKILIENFGSLTFSNPFTKNNEHFYNFTFSPFIYYKEKQRIYGQVKKADGTKSILTFNVVANKIYFSFEFPYGFNCDTTHY